MCGSADLELSAQEHKVLFHRGTPQYDEEVVADY